MSERLFDRRVTLNITETPTCFPEFEYYKPVMEPVSIQVPFYADTKENRAIRYSMVCAGYNDNPLPSLPRKTRHIDLLIRERTIHDTRDGYTTTVIQQIWLMAGQYTQEKRDRIFSSNTFEHMKTLSYITYLESMLNLSVRALFHSSPGEQSAKIRRAVQPAAPI